MIPGVTGGAEPDGQHDDESLKWRESEAPAGDLTMVSDGSSSKQHEMPVHGSHLVLEPSGPSARMYRQSPLTFS